MSSPGIVIDEGSVLGSHRGGFGGIDFSSLILFDIERLVQPVPVTALEQKSRGSGKFR